MRTRNKRYWIRRAREFERAKNKAIDITSAEIDGIFKASENGIREEIEKIKTELSRVTEISDRAKLEKLLTDAESVKSYSELKKLLEITTDEIERAEILNRINAQAYKYRITTLESIENRIFYLTKQAELLALNKLTTTLTKAYTSAYYGMIDTVAKGLDVGVSFTLLPTRAINAALKEPWKGSNYSARIWNTGQNFNKEVRDVVTKRLTGGYSMAQAEADLAFYNQKNSYAVRRLVKTETSHFYSMGQYEAYEEIGIEKYQYVCALDERTCDVCGSLDGMIFNIEEAVEGENYPTMHPNCRCTTVASFESKTRIARDIESGRNYKIDGSMTYKEWAETLPDEQRQALRSGL